MLLAFRITDLITVPFGYLLDWLYRFTSNYGVALILFAILVKLILMPASAKSKKSMMKMSRLTPRLQEIQQKYANDQAKQNEAMQQLYKQEGVGMTGGCLWSLLPLLVLLPLYTVIRQPITYLLHESAEVAEKIVELIKSGAPELFSKNTYYDQVVAAPQIAKFAQSIREAIPNISEATLKGINFNFLGIDLGAIPQFNIFAWEKYDWAHFGAFLLPVLSGGSQVLSMFIMNKLNNSVVTDENGVQDEQTAKNSQTAKSNKVMMLIAPLMSLWIGFTLPGALSLYWLIQGIVSIVIDVYLTKHYRKIYDAEDAERLKHAMEQEAIEAEKERIRAERRAANPEGITENTSKKKLQQKLQREQEQAKAAAAREYAARKGITGDAEEDMKPVVSGIPSRPYCRGRAYDPNRYSGESTEE